MSYRAVSGLIAPVVDDVVGKVGNSCAGDFSAEVSRYVVDYEVVVVGEIAVAHHDPEAVNALVMTSPRVCRSDDRILHGVVGVVGVKSPLLVGSPANRAVVNDAVRAFRAAPCVVSGARSIVRTRTRAEIAADYIVSAESHFIVFESDTGAAGSSLSRDSYVSGA